MQESKVVLNCTNNLFEARTIFDLDPSLPREIEEVVYGSATPYQDSVENIQIQYKIENGVRRQLLVICPLDLFLKFETRCTQLLLDFFERTRGEDCFQWRLLFFLGALCQLPAQPQMPFRHNDFYEAYKDHCMGVWEVKSALENCGSLTQMINLDPLYDAKQKIYELFEAIAQYKFAKPIYMTLSNYVEFQFHLLQFMFASCAPHKELLTLDLYKEQFEDQLQLTHHAGFFLNENVCQFISSRDIDCDQFRTLLLFLHVDNERLTFKRLCSFDHKCLFGMHQCDNSINHLKTLFHTQFSNKYEGTLINVILDCLKSRSAQYYNFAKVMTIPFSDTKGVLAIDADELTIDFIGRKITAFLQAKLPEVNIDYTYTDENFEAPIYAHLISFRHPQPVKPNPQFTALLNRPVPHLPQSQKDLFAKIQLPTFPSIQKIFTIPTYNPDLESQHAAYEFGLIQRHQSSTPFQICEMQEALIRKRNQEIRVLGKRLRREQDAEERDQPMRNENQESRQVDHELNAMLQSQQFLDYVAAAYNGEALDNDGDGENLDANSNETNKENGSDGCQTHSPVNSQ